MAYRKLSLLSFLTVAALGCGDDGSSTTDAAASSTGAQADDSSGTTSTEPGSTGADTTAGGSESSGEAGGLCIDVFPAIVTDIDETLTLSDAEFFMQIADGTYDPVAREGATELIEGYATLGYRILYLTARSEEIVLAGTGESARDATERWLEEHGFPMDPATTEVVLAPMFVVDADAQAYKAQALMDRQAAGQRFDYAYGNATSDIGAYAEAGIDLAATFIIGEHAGEGGTVAVAGEGWVEHTAMHLPTVAAACDVGD